MQPINLIVENRPIQQLPTTHGIGIFSVHRQIVDHHASYIRSFVTIADDELSTGSIQHLIDGHLWPEPLLTFNPAFATVGPVETVAKSGIFSPQVAEPQAT